MNVDLAAGVEGGLPGESLTTYKVNNVNNALGILHVPCKT
jgi:hypothetical protein